MAERLSLNITQQKRSLYIDAASILLIFGSIGGFAISARGGNMTFGEFVALSGAMTGIVNMVT